MKKWEENACFLSLKTDKFKLCDLAYLTVIMQGIDFPYENYSKKL